MSFCPWKSSIKNTRCKKINIQYNQCEFLGGTTVTLRWRQTSSSSVLYFTEVKQLHIFAVYTQLLLWTFQTFYYVSLPVSSFVPSIPVFYLMSSQPRPHHDYSLAMFPAVLHSLPLLMSLFFHLSSSRGWRALKGWRAACLSIKHTSSWLDTLISLWRLENVLVVIYWD